MSGDDDGRKGLECVLDVGALSADYDRLARSDAKTHQLQHALPIHWWTTRSLHQDGVQINGSLGEASRWTSMQILSGAEY
jgi:hypothetical protein